jgi:hypothetical protein
VAKSRSLPVRYLLSSGFLLVELMMAIFIGLVLISSLMRMQSTILELQDSFYMRDKALVAAIDWLECDDLCKKDAKSGVFANNGRNFRLETVQNTLGKTNKNKSITKVKVEWQSLAGKNRCLEI